MDTLVTMPLRYIAMDTHGYHSTQLPSVPETVDVSATGSGFSLLEVADSRYEWHGHSEFGVLSGFAVTHITPSLTFTVTSPSPHHHPTSYHLLLTTTVPLPSPHSLLMNY
ncbi:hypothetical protein ScPMuIL_006107 [Solemya velum]